MNLRERLLLLLTPLVLLPLILLILFSLFFLEKVSPTHSAAYGLFSILFVGLLGILVVFILLGLSNSIVSPVHAVIESAKRIAQGNLDHSVKAGQTDGDEEMKKLVFTIEEMRLALKQQKITTEESAALSAIGQITAQVAHDIRGPIVSMQTSVDYFLARSETTPECQKHIQLLALSTRRLFGIADDLVRKYRGEKDRRGLFSLHSILDNLIKEYSVQSKYSRVVFYRSYDPSDICLFQERVAVERVFANIIKNALEAIGVQGNLIVKTMLERDKVVVRIEDDGCGIEKDKLAFIFEDRFTSGKEGGTGLGLAFVKRTVEWMGGNVSVQSQLGRGTVFIVYLPIAQGGELNDGKKGGEKTGLLEKGNGDKGYKVLVIDDEPMIRLAWEVIQKKLSIEELYCYPNLESLLEAKLDLNGIDIAFVDKNIRDSAHSGAEVLDFLKSNGVSKVVLASGENEEELREEARFSQADFITCEKIPQSFKAFFS